MNAQPLVNKVWSFCHTLRDDGVGYGDYLEQLTYLIFLKLAAEYAGPFYNRDVGIPEGYELKSKYSLFPGRSVIEELLEEPTGQKWEWMCGRAMSSTTTSCWGSTISSGPERF